MNLNVHYIDVHPSQIELEVKYYQNQISQQYFQKNLQASSKIYIKI